MDIFSDPVLLARLQFACTAAYHFIFVPLTIGLGLILAINETRYYRSRDPKDAAATKFWVKIFTATFVLGLATGITMEFSFGTTGRITRGSSATSSVRRWRRGAARVLPGVHVPGRAAVRAQARVAEVLHGVGLARVVRLGSVGSVDPHCELVDADPGRRGAVRRRLEGRHHRLPDRGDEPVGMAALLAHHRGRAHHGRFVAMAVSAWYLIKNRHKEFA